MDEQGCSGVASMYIPGPLWLAYISSPWPSIFFVPNVEAHGPIRLPRSPQMDSSSRPASDTGAHHDQQRFSSGATGRARATMGSKQGEVPTPREVGVALPYRRKPDGAIEFLLVTSRKHADAWLFPKGGVEKGEDGATAAAREAWEEGACLCLCIVRHIGSFPTPRSPLFLFFPLLPSVMYTLSTLAAGIKGTVVRQLHSSLDQKPHKKSPSQSASNSSATAPFVPRSSYTFFLLRVDPADPSAVADDWLEKKERQRKWVSFDEARSLVAWRADGQVDAMDNIRSSDYQ